MKESSAERIEVDEIQKGLEALRQSLQVVDRSEEKDNLLRLQEGLAKLFAHITHAREDGTWRKSRFNLFRVMGRQRLEETHSNIISWLLDPDEAHGLGDGFLVEFMRHVFGVDPPSTDIVDVARELQEGGDRPDIVVTGRGWWLIIENKIGTREHAEQTHRYAERYKKKRGDSFFAYLTPSGGNADNDVDFKSVSYGDIRRILLGLSERWASMPDTKVFIQHLLKHIMLDLEIKNGAETL